MCLGIPVRIETIKGKTAVASAGGIKREIGIDLTPGVKVGEYVLLHAGFAIERISEKDAKETLALLDEMMDGSE